MDQQPRRTGWATVLEWMRQTTRPAGSPSPGAVVAVLLCTSYQTVLLARLFFDAGAVDEPVHALIRTWYGAVGLTVVVIGAAVLLLGRSRSPLLVVLVEAVLYVAGSSLGLENYLLFPLLFALFSVVARPPARQVLLGTGAVWLAMTLGTALTAPDNFVQEYLGQLVTALVSGALAIAARSVHGWRRSKERIAADEERARKLTQERDLAISRTRIAAELHDSVGHGLTTIIALAEGLTVATGDDTVDQALTGINSVARESLADTRRAVRSLASPADFGDLDRLTPDHDQDRSPVPTGREDRHGWERLSASIDRVRSLGVTVVLSDAGPGPVEPSRIGLCVAITLETLSNAVRHQRGLSRVDVSWVHHSHGSEIVIASEGGGAPQSDVVDPAAPTGAGLRRLRSRIEQTGGSLEHGWVRESEWVVRARLGAADDTTSGHR